MSLGGELERLLEVQVHDSAVDRLRHRRVTLPELDELATTETALRALATRLAEARARRDVLLAEETKLDGEAQSLQGKAAEVEARMYSGEVTSPRELQALQADVEQLRRHQRALESHELEVMEAREPADEVVAGLEAEEAALEERRAAVTDALGLAQGAIDDELAVELAARGEAAAPVDPAVLAAYEQCRARARGVGVARLVGHTCQGCHLTIPATEVEHIRKAAGSMLAHCDNCGCILVP